MKRYNYFFGVALLLLVQNTYATPIEASGTGLSSPNTFIDFGADLYPLGTPIFDEFSSSGVTFTSNIADSWSYETHGADVNSQSEGHVQRSAGTIDFGVFNINFSGTISDALFNFRAFTGTTWTLTSLLNGGIVESFNFVGFSSSDPITDSLYGFLDSNFNEIQIANHNDFAGFEIDNLQYNSVSEPTTLVFLALGLMGIGFNRRKRLQ